eukprot:8244471-Pyramimonas_sp.AAC.5
MDTECEEKHSWDFQSKETYLLVFALGWSSHPGITQHPLFTFGIQGWGPRASCFDRPINSLIYGWVSGVLCASLPVPGGTGGPVKKEVTLPYSRKI